MNPNDLMAEFETFKDKMSMGEQSQIYIDNLVKELQILWYSKELGDPRITKSINDKIIPMFELLASEMGKMVNEYQEKHGEI